MQQMSHIREWGGKFVVPFLKCQCIHDFHGNRPQGVFLIDPEPVKDERGMFMRIWCENTEFKANGFQATWVQSSVSVNILKGTLCGLHYQSAPHRGSAVGSLHCGSHLRSIVDLRPASPTYRQHVGITLSADTRRAVYIPKCCAMGFPHSNKIARCRTACRSSMCLQALEDFDG